VYGEQLRWSRKDDVAEETYYSGFMMVAESLFSRRLMCDVDAGDGRCDAMWLFGFFGDEVNVSQSSLNL
jgi:hypothetical protein